MVDYVCDLNCPPIPERRLGISYCCNACANASSKGCTLPRAERKSNCNEYNCKKYRIYVCYIWNGDEWVLRALNEVPIDVGREFCDAYNKLMESWRN